MAEKETNVFKDNDIAFADFAIESGSRFGSDILRAVKEFQVGSGATSFNANESGIWLGAKRFSDAPFSVDMAGNTKITGLVVTGGTINFGKTSITDTAHAGYYIGNTGIFMGNAGDTKSIKYDISAGTFVLKGVTLSWNDITSKPADSSILNSYITTPGGTTFISGTTIYSPTISAGIITGATVQSSSSSNTGVKMTNSGLDIYGQSSFRFYTTEGLHGGYIGSGTSQQLSIYNQYGIVTVGSSSTNIEFGGNITMSGSLYSNQINSYSIFPRSASSYDIGAYNNPFRNIYISGGLEFNGGSNFIAFYGGSFQLNSSIASTGDIYAGSDSGSLVAGASGYVAARGKYFIPVAGAYSSTKYYLREA